MAEHVDDRRRQVVPRWWPYRIAAELGQLDSAAKRRSPGLPDPQPGELEDLQRDWVSKKNPASAAGLVDAALVLGRPSIAVDAAEWLLTNGGLSNVSLSLARRVLSPPEADIAEATSVPSEDERYARVASIRSRLRRFPRNPLLWVELAREYSALGQAPSTRKALLTAIGLAPDNRFVLRSASRFFLHAHDPEQAHSILTRSAATGGDPWLLAAEIVAAQARGIPSRLTKRATLLVHADHFSPRHVSELASALGTLEHQAGNRRRVRKLFSAALEDPTENSVAQAAWLGRHMPGFSVPGSSLDAPRAFEARAWEAVQKGEFSEAVACARDWLADEPFATRPALFGAWVASTALGDHSTASKFAKTALIANPGDPRLVADLLYNRASAGDIDAAVELLPTLERLIGSSDVDRTRAEWDVLLAADRGLLAYRGGDIQMGREWYRQALGIALDHGLREFGASALINFEREEALASPSPRPNVKALQGAIDAFPPPSRGAVSSFVQRIVAK